MRARSVRAAPGFTLLELLVAITLLGLLMAAIFGGLRLGARVWEVSETRLDQSARLMVVHDFLRERLTQAYPLQVAGTGGASEAAFVGLPETVRLLTLMPEHLGAGFHLAQISLLEGEGGRRDLAIRWRPFDIFSAAEAAGDEAGPPLERVLLADVAALELAYYGAREGEEAGGWHASWEGEPLLPRLVRLRVTFAGGDRRAWPELIVPLVIDQTFDAGF